MAKYDLPAMVDYILNQTNQKNIYYMGHSEGTLVPFAKCSTDAAFNNKIKRFFALGPVVTTKHIKGALALLAPFSGSLGLFLRMVGVNQFLPHTFVLTLLAKTLCGWRSTNPLCDNILFLIAGPNSHQLNEATPPLYHLDRVTVPTYLFWGELDWLADSRDIRESILPHLRSLNASYSYKDFNHLDFIWGLRAAPEIYQKIVDIVKTEDGLL